MSKGRDAVVRHGVVCYGTAFAKDAAAITPGGVFHYDVAAHRAFHGVNAGSEIGFISFHRVAGKIGLAAEIVFGVDPTTLGGRIITDVVIQH